MRVLVVDDEPLIRLGMASMVEEAGFLVSEAASADEAIATLERIGDVSLIITDVDMPGGMDGLLLAHHVRRQWPQMGVIIVSGKVGLQPAELPEGARFFTKPFEEAPLLRAVRELSGGAQ
ncbi:MAG: response regulator [Devosia sp.]